VEDLPTLAGAHSVSVDPLTNEGFVPFGGVTANAVCSDGCGSIRRNRVATGARLASAAPVRLRLLLLGSAALIGLGSHRRPVG
jgi:hypothetical protein